MIVNLSALRKRAKQVLKGNLPFALMVTLIASMPALLSQIALNLSLGPVTEAMNRYLTSARSDADAGKILTDMVAGLSGQAKTMWILVAVSFLLLPFLNVGRAYYHLRLVRGMSAEVTDVFARIGCFFKAIAMQVMMLGMMIVWSLPGMALMLGSVVLALWRNSLTWMTALYPVGFGVSMVMMIHAYFKYSMAGIRMADQPHIGPVAALRWSRKTMKGLTQGLFMLLIVFFVYTLAAELASTLVEGISTVFSIVVALALSLLISCYFQSVLCVFYEEVALKRPDVA